MAVLRISLTNAPKQKINLKLLSSTSSYAGNNWPVTHLWTTLDCLSLTLQCVFISTPHFTSKFLKQVYFPDLFTILTSATVDHNGEWAILSGSEFFPLRVWLLLSHAHTELEWSLTLKFLQVALLLLICLIIMSYDVVQDLIP